MFDFLKSLFGKNIQPVDNAFKNQVSIEAEEVSTHSAPSKKSESDYFLRELKKCPYIKIESHETVLRHFRHEKSLTKTDNKLTADEKKIMGLNPRLSITKELIEVLTEEGLALENPKQALEDIYNKATIEKLRDESFLKAKKIGVKKFKFIAMLGECCDWCTQNNEKLHGLDILKLLNSGCTCKPYCKGYIEPQIEF
jgi:hypothetical protein